MGIGGDISNPSGLTLPLTPSQLAAFDNGLALSLPKWRAAVAGVKAGVNNAKILCVGNSITSGAYSNGSSTGEWKLLSWPNQLAKMFDASGVAAFCDSYMGYSDYTRDGRIVLTAPWASVPTATDATIGGNYLFSTTGGTSTGLAFTPVNPVDTFKLWTIKVSGAGVLGYRVNAEAESTLDLNASTALASATITATSLGTNTLNLRRVSGGNVFSVGIEAWNSATPCVQIINAGWDGATTTNWVDNSDAYAPSRFAAIGANLTIFSLGINDILPENGPIAVATTKANMTTLVANALTTGDVIILCENPAVVANTQSLANQALYWSALKDIANANNLAIVDIFSRWVSYEYSSPLGYYQTVGGYPANLHPVGLGYADYAQAIFNVIGNP